ncbi:MAG: GatB/YqeY domain-containing protein [Gallionella sp.]
MPQPLTEAEVLAEIDAAIAATGAVSAQDMGKVMAMVKPKFVGRADMSKVSGLIKGNYSAPPLL